MSDHDADVVAVLADGFERHWGPPTDDPERLSSPSSLEHAAVALAALSAAGIRCLYVPDKKIEHGARLKPYTTLIGKQAYTIEATMVAGVDTPLRPRHEEHYGSMA